MIAEIKEGVVIETKEHPLYIEGGPHIVGKYQLIYSSPKGKISLVKILNSIDISYYLYKDYWEIYCLEGDLFSGTIKYETKEVAELVIFGLLK